jgi:polyisoprenoid-binding protein YceI
MRLRVALSAVLVIAAASLGACRNAPGTAQGTTSGTQPSVAPGAAVSGTRYIIDAGQSQVLVFAYRDGAMAHLGHNHVIAIRQLTGSVLLAADRTQSSFQMDFPVEAMSVDEPALRAAEGPDFQSTVDEAAIAGTRDHMLGESLLNSKQFPQIHLQSQQILDTAEGLSALTVLVVRTTNTQVKIPVTLQIAGSDLIASGEFDVTHAQLGLTPYSVALGALRVAERIHVRYRVSAHRQP